MKYIYINGKILECKDAVISIDDRGFLYGDGLFETILFYNNKPYQWLLHISRLEGGLHVLKIIADINAEKLLNISHDLMEKNNISEGMIRIFITGGKGGRGYIPNRNEPATIIVELLPKIAPPSNLVGVYLCKTEKISTKALPSHIKSMQGLNSTLARMEANDNGCFEALLLNAQKEICECSSGNIFWFEGGRLYTPSLDCGILAGTTRDAVIRLSPYIIEEGCFDVAKLSKADEVFITNVSWGVLPISTLYPLDISWSNHCDTEKIKLLLEEDIINATA